MKNIILFTTIILISALCSCEKDKDKPTPLITSVEVTDIKINGNSDGKVDLTVSGGTQPYIYKWSNGTTTEDLENVPAGTYYVTVTDLDKQTALDTAIINEPGKILVTAKLKDVSTFGGSNGSIDLTVSGGVSPYIFNWSNGINTEDLTNIKAGEYIVTVSDANNAELIDTFTIYEGLSVKVISSDVTEFNGSNGEITLNVSGGKEPFIYEWSNGAVTKNLTALSSDFYSVTITDSRDLILKKGIPIYEPVDTSIPEGKILQTAVWSGNASIKIELDNKLIYFDPVSMSGAKADFILITHSHGDHYDLNNISALADDNTIIFAPGDIKGAISNAVSSTVITLLPGQDTTINNMNIKAVPAYNIVKTSWHPKSNHWVGYLVTVNGMTIYHSGDTERIPEMKDFTCNIAFLPLGQTYTMNAVNDAAESAKDVQAHIAVPMHYGPNEGTIKDAFTFKQLLKGTIPVYIMKN